MRGMIEIIRNAAGQVGGIQSLAKQLQIKSQSFYRWRKIPAERVLEIERLTGISRHELRPDLYPKDGEAA